MSVEIGTFEKDGKKYPTIQLKNGDESKFGFTFGLSKAKLILDHLEDIRQFVEDNRVTEN